MTKYRKRPVVIDAFKFDGTVKCLKNNVPKDDLENFCFEYREFDTGYDSYGYCYLNNQDLPKSEPIKFYINTLEGSLEASKGDYIIRGVNGEYYSCKPDVFAKTYESVDDDINYVEAKGVYTVNKHQNNNPQEVEE